jgi:hypothetical protein
MPSAAAINYKALAVTASVVLKADRTSLTRKEVQAVYGAAFVAQVAAWNTYIAGLIPCFYQEVADPRVPAFHAMHTLANAAASFQLGRFYTPNAENTRNLIVYCTGYDPFTDWQWPARGMSALAVRLRLNEILKVRHSLAHGFSMPGYAWTQAASGEVRLTIVVLAWTRVFLTHLVKATDAGLRNHVHTVYGVKPAW